MPIEKPIGLEVVKMCEAFARAGLKVNLVCPWKFNPLKEDPFKYYNIERNFRIKKLPHFDPVPLDKFLGPLASWLGSLEFSFVSFLHLVFTGSLKSDIVFFSHDHFSLFLPSFFSKNVFYEIHDFPRLKSFVHNFFWQRLFKNLNGFIVTNSWKKQELEKIFGINSKQILVCPNGIDPKDFEIKETKEECRKKLGLSLDKKIVLYTGHLFSWKGADNLAQASQYLSEGVEIYFVGGMKEDIKKFKITNSRFNIRMVDHRPHSEIPYWLKAADILVLPNTAKEDISKYWTSPMKMFEYMASKKPIIASDLPSIREILNENNAVLVKPDSPEALARSIKEILQNPQLFDKITWQAFQDIQGYTWQKRAEKITEFINKSL